MNIENLFQQAVQQKASDLHLVVGLKPVVRVDGELVYLEEKELSASAVEEMVFSILSDGQKERLKKEKEMDVSFEVKAGDRFRINVRYERDNLSLVARIISQKIPTLKELEMPEVVDGLLKIKQGLILVTGPTGCGKSTTLAAMIEDINQKQNKNIITLEDPIEFVFKSQQSIITQRQLGTDMVSFKSGLKHIVRQDPDVIMIGEMRDLETVAATVTLAETGHLVLATLHTYSAAQTIDRIIDIFPSHQQGQIKMQLSSVLAAVVSQRLISKKKEGRVAAREILVNTPAVANLIRESKLAQVNTIIETSAKEGMITMEKSLKNLHKAGVIDKEEMDAHLLDPWDK